MTDSNCVTVPEYVPPMVQLPRPELVNLSTRARSKLDDGAMIGGFIVRDGPVTVSVRAIGPDLESRGISGTLQDPTLSLYRDTTLIASNDDWIDAPNASVIREQMMAPADSRESVIMTELAPGAYTAIVRGRAGTTGIALFEVFHVSGTGSLVNLSTRGPVLTGDNVMIGGFMIRNEPMKVVVRALGPDLTARGVPGALEDPTVEIYSGSTLIGSNDNWLDGGQVEPIRAAGLAPGHERDAAIMLKLPPGAYTAIVRGKNGLTGIGLVEVFKVGQTTEPYPGPGD